VTTSDAPSDAELLAGLHAEIAAETEAIAALRDGVHAAESEIARSKSERYWKLREANNIDGAVVGFISIIVLALVVATVIR
jgi:hypothetical protein